MSITTKTIKQSPHACGYCTTGNPPHAKCPGGVLNGNQTEIVLCGCNCELSQTRRCLNCNNRSNTEVSESTWTCIDVEACESTQAKRREAAEKALFGDRTPESFRKQREVKEKAPRAAATPKTGSCLCCGEATKGGLFLPGHDARWLSVLVALVKDGVEPAEEIRRRVAEKGVSDAYLAKFDKRVSA